MREESHLEDMRAAIRGDFERLEERLGTQVLLRPRQGSEVETRPRERPLAEPEPELPPVAADHAATAEPKRSWIDRLLGL